MTALPKADAAEPTVLTSYADGVRHLRLNRPHQRNALSVALMTDLEAALDEAAGDASVKVVVIGAKGPAFCAGHDLKELRANPGEEFYRRLFVQCSRLMTKIVRLPKPVIARIHGIATAAGCQLVASCDLAVATEDVRFATPGVNIGLFCSTPMVALSRNISRKAAMEMLLTGDMVPAERARELGLINRVVPLAALDETVGALARQIASKSPLTLKIGKEAFYRQAEMSLDDAYAHAAEVMTRNMMARDAEEGIDAFIQKRPATWCGA